MRYKIYVDGRATLDEMTYSKGRKRVENYRVGDRVELHNLGCSFTVGVITKIDKKGFHIKSLWVEPYL